MGDIKAIKEEIRIPLTPIKIKAHVLHQLFEILYPKFINDQQDILDVIVSNDGKKILEDLYLYKTNKVGIHRTFTKLPKNIISNQEINVENIDEFFNNIQLILAEKEKIHFSTLRIFKQKVIELINEHYINIETLSGNEFLKKITHLIQKLLSEELIYIYPIPNAFNFAKKSLKFLNGIDLTRAFVFINEILPEFNLSILLGSEKSIFVLKLLKAINSQKKSEFNMELLTLDDLDVEIKGRQVNEILNIVCKKLHTESSYFLNLNDINSLFLELCDLKIPPNCVDLQLLFQKILFGYRSFETKWFVIPRPIVYNQLFRFFVRLFGFNLNQKKVSHWAIPSLIFNSFHSFFGLNSRILTIITDMRKPRKKLRKKKDFLKLSFENALLFEIENKTLTKITPLNKNQVISEDDFNSFNVIRKNVSKKFGFITAVITIDVLLLHELLDCFVFKLYKLAPFSKLKTLKMIKKPRYFNMYPELPPFKLIKNLGFLSLIKILLPIVIDKHEF